MKFPTINDYNLKKVSTKEELKLLLEKYRGILSITMIEYLNDLIELDYSVVRNYISDNDRNVLSELDVYTNIARYNIYNRALNLFNQSDVELNIRGNDNGEEGLKVRDLKSGISLFDYSYKYYGKKNFCDYNELNVGDICLYQTLESKELREKELDMIMQELERLYDKKNPYSSSSNRYGGPYSRWNFEHLEKIREYEKKFAMLDNKKDLTDVEKREVELTNKFYKLLYDDYGLKNEDFVEFIDKDRKDFWENSAKSKLRKTLIKRMPGLYIKKDIKYI